jgi:hypothetical protein
MEHAKHDSELLEYYIRLWGQPSERHPFLHPDADSLQPCSVYVFADPADPPTWIYATLGASHQPLPHPDPHRDAYMELFIMTNHPYAELVESIGALALYPFVHRTFLGEGHTIHGRANEGIVAGSPLTDILIANADYGEDLPMYVVHANGRHTHLFWVTPIYASEREYAVTKGWQTLTAAFDQHQTDVYDLWRLAVI